MRKNKKMKAGRETRTPHAGSCEMAVGPAEMVVELAEEEVGVDEIAEDEAEEMELVLLDPDTDPDSDVAI